MKVAVIGAGNVGSQLAAELIRNGAEVVFGARNPSSEKTQAAVAAVPGSKALTTAEAADWCTALILAIPGMTTQEQYNACAASLGAGAAGKVVIDATNPLSAFPSLEVYWDGNTSGGEMCSEAFSNSSVFKAFNTIGREHMGIGADGRGIPGYDAAAGPLSMLFAGDKGKESEAAAVVKAAGFSPRYVGPIRYARNLEAIGELWIHAAVPPAGFTKENWGRQFHFQVVGSTSGAAAAPESKLATPAVEVAAVSGV